MVLAWFSGFLWGGAMRAFGWVLSLRCVDVLIVVCGLLGFGFGVGVICVFFRLGWVFGYFWLVCGFVIAIWLVRWAGVGFTWLWRFAVGLV